jgi:DMSO/TMAO reductase YedYZ molybdopterin-dependent catalytic subunit
LNLLIHYDVADIDPDDWTLEVSGAVDRPLRLSLADLRARPASMSVATMECAGNGRAPLDPRPLSQPWLLEAVGTAAWSGVPVAAILEEAGVQPDAVEVVFTGADRDVEGGQEQHYERADHLRAADGDNTGICGRLVGWRSRCSIGCAAWPLRCPV